MKGGGGAPKNYNFFFNSKFFLVKIFFEFKKLIKIFEKFHPIFDLPTHPVPVVGDVPDCSWKKSWKLGNSVFKRDQ